MKWIRQERKDNILKTKHLVSTFEVPQFKIIVCMTGRYGQMDDSSQCIVPTQQFINNLPHL